MIKDENHSESVSTLPKLNLMEKTRLLGGTISTDYFNKRVRPMLYRKCGNDPELVNELILSILHEERNNIKLMSPLFIKPKKLQIKVNGIDIIPFGTAAGMDKNGDALAALGQIFGFQEAGTVVLNPREGNKRPRVSVDEKNLDLYNAQGFPSKGLDYFLDNVSEYRRSGGKGIIYVSVCGLPISEDNAVQTAIKEMEELLKRLNPYVNGFVWNPFSPNTAALKLLREPSIFYETSLLMKSLAEDKLRLVKIGPYEPDEKDSTLGLVRKFLEGGGHGVVTTNTKMFQKEELPDSIRDIWGYQSAGRSGAFLRDYRMRSIKDIRSEFPGAIIVGTGGIYNSSDAYDTFNAGADMVEGYTPYTYFGSGLVRNIMDGVSRELRRNGFNNLKDLQILVKKSVGSV